MEKKSKPQMKYIQRSLGDGYVNQYQSVQELVIDQKNKQVQQALGDEDRPIDKKKLFQQALDYEERVCELNRFLRKDTMSRNEFEQRYKQLNDNVGEDVLKMSEDVWKRFVKYFLHGKDVDRKVFSKLFTKENQSKYPLYSQLILSNMLENPRSTFNYKRSYQVGDFRVSKFFNYRNSCFDRNIYSAHMKQNRLNEYIQNKYDLLPAVLQHCENNKVNKLFRKEVVKEMMGFLPQLAPENQRGGGR